MNKNYIISIDTPIDQTFAAFDSKEKIIKWMGAQFETKFLNSWDPNNPVGTKFTYGIKGIIELQGEVIAYEKPRVLGLGQKYKVLNGTLFYYFQPGENNSTLVTCELEIATTKTFQKLIVNSLMPLFDRLITKQLKGLKALVEEAKS